MKYRVISLGGSVFCPKDLNISFLSKFSQMINAYLKEYPEEGLIFVCGGGYTARLYQKAYFSLNPVSDEKNKEHNEAADYIGMASTYLNARFIQKIFHLPDSSLLHNFDRPTQQHKLYIAYGFLPGCSTDYDAVELAHVFGTQTVINLSNVDKIYTHDPKKYKEAKALDSLDWSQYFQLFSTQQWVPGMHSPFDFKAAELAHRYQMDVYFAQGSHIDNVAKILKKEPFYGSLIQGSNEKNKGV